MDRRDSTLIMLQNQPEQALGLPFEDYQARKVRKLISDCYHSIASSSSDSSDHSTVTSSVSHSRSHSTSSSKLQSPEKRLMRSMIQYATRQALATAFVPEIDVPGDVHRRRGEVPKYSDDDSEPPVPQKFIDEFNRRWHEDHEGSDIDRHNGSPIPRLRRSKHPFAVKGDVEVCEMLWHIEKYQGSYGSEGRLLPMYREDSRGMPVGMVELAMAPVGSRFDWDSSDDDDDEADSELNKQRVLRKSIPKRWSLTQ